MRGQGIRRPSFASTIAVLALFVALGGSSYAEPVRSAAKRLITGKQIKDGSLGIKDLSRAARQQLAGQTGAKGDPGSPGTPGAQGPQGAAGPQGERGLQGEAGEDGRQGAPGPAEGPAGGALTGNYPNPGLAAGAVGPGHLQQFPAVRRSGPVEAFDNDCDGLFEANSSSKDIWWRTPEFAEDIETSGQLTCNSGGNSAGYFQIPRTGLYLLTAQLSWIHDPDGPRALRLMRLPPNAGTSTPLAASEVEAVEAPGMWTQQSVTTIVRLTENDLVWARAWQDSGGHLQMTDGHFAAAWLGP